MPDFDSLEAMLTPSRLLRMAGEATFARGVAYACDGRVQELALSDGMLAARVAGTETYQVRLWKHGAEVEFDCTCPVGDALRFCKHGVAAGLAWLAAAKGDEPLEGPAPAAPRENPLERVGAYLEALDASALRELLLAEAASDDGLRERLLVRETVYAADSAAVQRLRDAMACTADAVGHADDGEASMHPADSLGVYRQIDPVLVDTSGRTAARA